MPSIWLHKFVPADFFPVAKPDGTQGQTSSQVAPSRASAYLSSWGSWAAEKRKQGWRKNESTENVSTAESLTTVAGKDPEPSVGAVALTSAPERDAELPQIQDVQADDLAKEQENLDVKNVV